jgi:diguanylate cyclase
MHWIFTTGYAALTKEEAMKQTEQTLLEQMRITEFEVEHRKTLFSFTADDVAALLACRPLIEKTIDSVVEEFYRLQTSVTEIALLIGDSDTLERLRSAQRRYVQDLFSGVYDLEYINNRLRIGLVHKRIGVEPKLYLSAIHTLKQLLTRMLSETIPLETERVAALSALDKLMLFDVTLVFDTYIRSLVSEIETAKDRSERYARIMEEKVKERTSQLDELSRTDALTGLLNHRQFEETVTKSLRFAQRRMEPLTAVYLDVNDFKTINDTQGHQRGDEVLRTIGKIIKSISRADDTCFRAGGDEFCVIMSNCAEPEARAMFVARLNEKVAQSLEGISVSCGIAQTGPVDFVDANTLIRVADDRMYQVKHAYRSHKRALASGAMAAALPEASTQPAGGGDTG